MRKRFWIFLGLGAALFGAVLLLQFGGVGAPALWSLSHDGKWILPLVVAASLVDSVNPCAISVLLITIAFLLSLGRSRGNILKVGGFYIAGIFAAYILIGLGILQALHLFNTPHFMAKAGAALLILWGLLEIINTLFPSFPLRLKIPDAVHRPMAGLMERASLPAAFVLGALVGICEFPCTGGPYLMVLGLLHDQATRLAGLGYLVLYNLVFVSPLVVILLIASDSGLIEKVKSWKKAENMNMRVWGGAAMVLLGALMFFF